MRIYTRKPIEERFWSKVIKREEGCWGWNGNKHLFGYGLLFNGTGEHPICAHRVSWVIHFGQIPNSLHVLHRCDTPECVRPDHLFLGTHKDNMYDKKAKKRAPIGSRNKSAKLNESDVQKIRAKYVKGKMGVRRLGKEFGVSFQTICRVIKRTHWRHI